MTTARKQSGNLATAREAPGQGEHRAILNKRLSEGLVPWKSRRTRKTTSNIQYSEPDYPL